MIAEDQSFIAYTLIVKRTDGKLMFLVRHEETSFLFPGITSEKAQRQTALSQIIDEMKGKLNLNFDKIELAELTNAIIQEHRIPLFVFDYHCGAEQPNDLLLPESNLEWQISDHFEKTLQKYEIYGVPTF